MSFLQQIPRPVKTYHTATYDRISPSKTNFRGNGKTVLITGGAGGIGFEISRSFAEAGVARIVIVSRTSGTQARAKQKLETDFPGVEIVTFQAAITDNARVIEVMKDVGIIDVLVLNAAYSHEQKPLLNIPPSQIVNAFDTNTLGNWNVLRAYLDQKSSPKTVIHVSSAAVHLRFPYQIGYGSSKAAFNQIIQALSAEFTPQNHGIRMFNFHPGAILTDMARASGFDEKTVGLEWEDARLPGDFAVWLAGPESDFLNGRFVWAQWDVDELIGLRERAQKDPGFLTIGLLQ